jgi:hypothetical protein
MTSKSRILGFKSGILINSLAFKIIFGKKMMVNNLILLNVCVKNYIKSSIIIFKLFEDALSN